MDNPEWIPSPAEQEFLVDLRVVCLFPEVAQEIILQDIAKDWGATLDDVRFVFNKTPLLHAFFKEAWTRWLEPTSQKAHEITALVARVRAGAATDREVRWLGAYSVAALMNSDLDALTALKRLGTKKRGGSGDVQVLLAAMDFFERHQRAPRKSELEKFVEAGQRKSLYSAVDLGNWNRHVRRSGVDPLFVIARLP